MVIKSVDLAVLAPLSISAPFISLKDLWSGVTLSSTTHSHSERTRCLDRVDILVAFVFRRVIVADIVFHQKAFISRKQDISNHKCKDINNAQMSTIRLLESNSVDF